MSIFFGPKRTLAQLDAEDQQQVLSLLSQCSEKYEGKERLEARAAGHSEPGSQNTDKWGHQVKDGVRTKSGQLRDEEGFEQGEPYVACVAGVLGIGPKVYDGWYDNFTVYTVTEQLEGGANLAEWLGLRSDDQSEDDEEDEAHASTSIHSSEEWKEADHALSNLYKKWKQQPNLYQWDLQAKNIVLHRDAHGELVAKGVDWEYAEYRHTPSTNGKPYEQWLALFQPDLRINGKYKRLYARLEAADAKYQKHPGEPALSEQYEDRLPNFISLLEHDFEDYLTKQVEEAEAKGATRVPSDE